MQTMQHSIAPPVPAPHDNAAMMYATCPRGDRRRPQASQRYRISSGVDVSLVGRLHSPCIRHVYISTKRINLVRLERLYGLEYHIQVTRYMLSIYSRRSLHFNISTENPSYAHICILVVDNPSFCYTGGHIVPLPIRSTIISEFAIQMLITKLHPID